MTTAERIPSDGDAEWSVLAAFHLEPDLIGEYSGQLPDAAFTDAATRTIWRAMKTLYGRGDSADPVSLADYLREAEALEEIGGEATLAQMVGISTTAANVEYHVGILQDKLIRRRTLEIGDELRRRTLEAEAGEAREVLDWGEAQLGGVALEARSDDYVAMSDLAWDLVERVDEAAKNGGPTGLTTGIGGVDRMTSGFQPASLVVVAARPSMGKTALACDISRHAALEEQTPVGFVSLEMGREMLGMRLMCPEAGLPLARVKAGDVQGEREWEALTKAASRIHGAPIYIEDAPTLSILELRSRARRMHRREGIGLLVVDYLQLLSGDSSAGHDATREQQVASISRGLKAIARELEIPVVALSQLNRNLEHRSDKRPQLADLRESGAIEQDADLVLFVHRPEFFFGPKGEDGEDLRGQAEIIVGKQRNGPTGTVRLRWDRETVSFTTHRTPHRGAA